MAYINGEVDYSVDDLYDIVHHLNNYKKETMNAGKKQVSISLPFLMEVLDLTWSVADISEDNEEPEKIEYDEEYWKEFWAVDYDYLNSLDGCLTKEVPR